MSELTTTALAGAAAGLGVAMPVGAVGVLLVQQSMRGPRRAAVAAAAAVAVVDMAYAALATAVGPMVSSALSGREAWVRLLSAAVLLAIAAHGLLSSRTSLAAPGAPAAEPAPDGGAGTLRTFLRFAGITLVNPTTALYFAALTTAQGSSLDGGAAGAVFVGAVFAASLGWQQLLVTAGSFAGSRISAAARAWTAGSFAGSRISAAARAWTFRVGYGLVAVYAVKIALPLP
ncbi:LysE family transporter [Streptomyces bambusae]|uniref:LysE family transporter n=1 Tax=Streptomyces bambusae TaxID=1550616 RepID=UPI001CFF16F1|nr:LysE family transporter [Streptomyces bambusae]MCB5164854.1 LysE family transporter [Streptomyces bambusae]